MRIGRKRPKNRNNTVFIVLMVSTSDCGSASMGSNPINHPIQRVTQVGEGDGLLNR